MSDDHGGDLGDAIFTLLAGASPQLVGGRIYDGVPHGTDLDDDNFPYIHIGEIQQIPDPTSGADGNTDSGIAEYVTLHIWSRHAGRAELQGIISQLFRLFDAADLSIAGRTSGICRIDNTRLFDDPDGVSRHGVVSLEIIHRT